jgi:predicted flap endonuclease-1-like 5' DNA nuclease
MKKFLKLLALGAFMAGITWILRDQLLPGPTRPTSHPPAFRNPPPPPPPHHESPATDTGDDLTAVNGIGPVYAKRLADIGIASFAELAAADPTDLASRADLPEERLPDWISQASELA